MNWFLQKWNCYPRWRGEAKYKLGFDLNAINHFQKSPPRIMGVGFSNFRVGGILIPPVFNCEDAQTEGAGLGTPGEWARPEVWVLQSLFRMQSFYGQALLVHWSCNVSKNGPSPGPPREGDKKTVASYWGLSRGGLRTTGGQGGWQEPRGGALSGWTGGDLVNDFER